MCSSVMAVQKTYVFKKLNKGGNEAPYCFLLVLSHILQPGLWDFAFLFVSDW